MTEAPQSIPQQHAALRLLTRKNVLAGLMFIAVGALTHSAPVLDIALDLRPLGVGAATAVGA